MFVILKGTPFQGAVTLTAHGPFLTERAGIDWAVEMLEGEPEWFVMEVRHPDELSSVEDDNTPGELVEVPVEELERMIAETESRRRKPLKKEVMIDLSEIKE